MYSSFDFAMVLWGYGVRRFLECLFHEQHFLLGIVLLCELKKPFRCHGSVWLQVIVLGFLSVRREAAGMGHVPYLQRQSTVGLYVEARGRTGKVLSTFYLATQLQVTE